MPYSQQDHDESVEDFGRVLVLAAGIVIGVALIIIFG